MSSFGSTYELRELNEEVKRLRSEAKETNKLLGEIVSLLKEERDGKKNKVIEIDTSILSYAHNLGKINDDNEGDIISFAGNEYYNSRILPNVGRKIEVLGEFGIVRPHNYVVYSDDSDISFFIVEGIPYNFSSSKGWRYIDK